MTEVVRPHEEATHTRKELNSLLRQVQTNTRKLEELIAVVRGLELAKATNKKENVGDRGRGVTLATKPPVTLHRASATVPPLWAASVLHIQDAQSSLPNVDIAADRSLSDSSRSVGDEEDPAPHIRDIPARGGRLAGSTKRNEEDTCHRTKVEDKLRAYLPDSVYLWACGVKAAPEDEDVSATDMAAGWLTLFTQIMSYLALVLNSDDPEEGGSYSIFSVGLAMYLMVVIAAPDIRAGYTLLSFGRSALRRTFGACLLCSMFLLVYASMRVLFAEASGNAELVIGAATVLFITDVDEKMMMVLRTKHQQWRMFCVLETFGFSFWLALVGVLYLGDPGAISPLGTATSGGEFADNADLHYWVPSFFVFAFTPGTITCCALVLNNIVLKLGAARAAADVARLRGLLWFFDFLSDWVREDPLFAGAWIVLLIDTMILGVSFSYTVITRRSTYRDVSIVSGGVLAVAFIGGLVAFVARGMCGTSRSTRSRWATLCIGWGIGAAIGVAVVSDTEPPSLRPYSLVGGLLVFSMGILAFADTGMLGWAICRNIKRFTSVLQNTDGILYWAVMGSVDMCMASWITYVYLGITWGIIR